MPLFHFDVRYDHEDWSEGDVGIELASVEQAGAEALELIAGLAREKLREYSTLAVRVRDGEPGPVLTLSLSLRAKARA